LKLASLYVCLEIDLKARFLDSHRFETSNAVVTEVITWKEMLLERQ
jgi:hypothetical protein